MGAIKMPNVAYGVAGNDLSFGAKVPVRAALSDGFANASGRTFDDDQGQFSEPHPDAPDATKTHDRLKRSKHRSPN